MAMRCRDCGEVITAEPMLFLPLKGFGTYHTVDGNYSCNGAMVQPHAPVPDEDCLVEIAAWL